MKRTSFLKPVLLVAFILAFSSTAFALDFSFDTVAYGDSVGFAKDAVCGPDGRIHLSYMNNAGGNDSTSGDVKYAVYDGSIWTVETVIAPGDYLSSNTSIALDTGGDPHILYNYTCGANEHLQDLDHAWWDGSQWQTENIFDGASLDYRPGHPSLAISNNNVANAVFHVFSDDISASEMFWAKKQLPSGSWETEKLEGVLGSHTSMALDNSGYPHVSYRIGCSNTLGLGYSYYDGSFWVYDEIVSGDVRGTCMAFDPSGNPCISYVDVQNPSVLYYAYKDGSDWEVESVDQDGKIMCEFTSLGFASDGTPFIAYVDAELVPKTLKVAQRNSGGGWTVTEVDETYGLSCQLQNVSLVVDNQNNVHAFYNGYNDSEVVAADINHAVADTGIAVDDVTDDSSGGGCNSMALVPFSLLLLTPLALLLKK